VPFEHVRTVARLADRDEWRNRIRALASRYGQLDRQVVEELASKPEAAALPPAPSLLLAAALRRVGAREKALEILYAAQQHAPADLRLNVELALHSQLTLDESAGFLRAALALRPQSPGLHFSLGDRLLTRGALDQAIAAFRKAVELKPDYTDAYFKLGIALGRKRTWDDALAAYGKAIQLDRDLSEPHYRRGRVYAELGQWEMAAADYQRAAELYPPEPERWCEHAGVLLLAGKHKPYRELCDRVLEMVRKGNTLGGIRIVVTFQSVGARTAYLAARTCVLAPDAIEDPARAVRLAEQAVAADPPCAWYLHTLGMAHYRAGDFDQAIQRLRESIDAKPAWPANVTNWLGLAMAYHRLGQTEEARQWLDKALQWIDKATPKSPQEALGSIPGLDSSHDWLACHVLRREAEALVDAKARPTPKDK
jgi:tetratricopeptide (TPR) repeat protein